MQKRAMHLDVNWDCVFGLCCFCEVFEPIHALANCNALIIIIVVFIIYFFKRLQMFLISFFATLIPKTLFFFPILNSWDARVN